jgi:type I restriction enzyme S subunit
VVGRKGNVGNVTWIDGPCWPIDTAYFVDTNLPLRFVVDQLRRIEFLNSHAAVPGLNRDDAYSRLFLLPPPEVMAAYSAVADNFMAAASRHRSESDRLAGIRDLLLPRLVTGRVDVSDLDLDALVEGAA